MHEAVELLFETCMYSQRHEYIIRVGSLNHRSAASYGIPVIIHVYVCTTRATINRNIDSYRGAILYL